MKTNEEYRRKVREMMIEEVGISVDVINNYPETTRNHYAQYNKHLITPLVKLKRLDEKTPLLTMAEIREICEKGGANSEGVNDAIKLYEKGILRG